MGLLRTLFSGGIWGLWDFLNCIVAVPSVTLILILLSWLKGRLKGMGKVGKCLKRYAETLGLKQPNLIPIKY